MTTTVFKTVPDNEPKVLILDLETSPNLGFTWQRWEQNVIDVVKDWYILSFSYKWVGEKKVHVHALPDFSGYNKDKEDDRKLCEKLWELLDEADIVVAHNGDQFDFKKSNARFLVHGLVSPSPYKTVDTKKVAKKYFKFDSNKLDELGRQLGIGRKMQHGGFELWKGCMSGDKKSWKTMKDYNIQDVLLLEKVFMKMRPWIGNYPIVSPYAGVCRNCGGVHLAKRGFSYVNGGKYKVQRLRCDCGAWNVGEKSLANE